MMFCALGEFFILLFSLTNVDKHFWRHCWGLGFLSIFGDCVKKRQQAFFAPLLGKQLA